MSIEKDSLVNLFGNATADFLDKEFKNPSQYAFINRYIKGLKKKISLSVSVDKVADDKMTLDEFENSLKSNILVNAKYNGYFIKGSIVEADLYELLCFFNCNNVPKVDVTNNSLLFYNNQYRIFINNFDSSEKNIAILFKIDSNDSIKNVLNTYFSKVDEIKEMNENDVIKLSYDIEDLDYKSGYSDYNTGANLLEVQDALFKTYSYNPIDYLLTLGLIYRLKILGWDKSYIDYIAVNNRGFNILNSNTHIKLNKGYVDNILNLGYIDNEYSITESGRSALLLLNHITPIGTNNYSNFYATVSNIVSSQKIPKDKLVSIGINNNTLFGIRDEFYVGEKALSGMATGMFPNDSNYAVSISNSVNILRNAKAIGYTSNVTISNTKSLEFEICQNLFNTFNDESLNIFGGLIAIKTYNSKEFVYVNSLIYKLITTSYSDVTVYVSGSNSDYVLFKDGSGETVAIIKSKNFSCQKEFIGTQDLALLLNKITKDYNVSLFRGLNISENQPNIIGVGFIEKAELSPEDYKKLLSVPFKELRSALGIINKDNYFSELDVNEVIAKVISERKLDYDKFESDVKEQMGKKLKALEVINEYYVSTGNEEKKTYYFDIIESFKEKINNFRL
ncbi:MAG: hypothetical protein IPJ01_11730 [Micavibrio sp.]|nr:hypothetical protein [Micavibrio sp.]